MLSHSGHTGLQLTGQDPAEAYAWILYVDPSVHIKEFALVKNASLESFIHIQDIRQATSPRPDWMDTLPCVVDTKARMAYRGHSCMEKLVSIELPPEHMKRLAKATSRRTKWAS
jgi:hypothetical protein